MRKSTMELELKKLLLAILLIPFIRIVAYTERDWQNSTTTTTATTMMTPTASMSSRSDALKVYDRMKLSFLTIARNSNVTLASLLQKTWFQIAEVTPNRMRQLGLFEVLPVQPSPALIALFDKTSVSQLDVSYKIITNHPTLAGKNFSFPLLAYLFAALELDTKELTVKILRDLPVGSKSIDPLFGAADASFKTRRYLTDVYPTIRGEAACLKIILATANSYYETHSLQTFTFVEFKQLMGSSNYEFLKKARSKYAKAVIEMDRSKASLYEREMEAKRSHVVQEKRTVLYESFISPLASPPKRCNINLANTHTISEVLQQCINVSKQFPLGKLHFIKNTALLNGISAEEMATYLKVPMATFAQYTVAKILQLSASSEVNDVTPVIVIASSKRISRRSLVKENLLDFGRKVKMIPDPSYLSDEDIKKRLENGTLEKLPRSLSSRMKKTLKMNWVLSTPYSFLMKALIAKTIDAAMMKNVFKGLNYTWNFLDIGKITDLFSLKQASVNQTTLIGLANFISSISHKEFIKMFRIGKDEKLVDNAKIKDISDLLRFNEVSKAVAQHIPNDLVKWLISLPETSKKLLTTVKDVAKSRKISLGDITFSNIVAYGSWKESQMNTLFDILGVPKKFYQEVKPMPMSKLRHILHTPEDSIGSFNVISLVRALCRQNHRYRHGTCVPFSGCEKASPSLCKTTATCENVFGSFYCKCKRGVEGKTNDCYEKPSSKNKSKKTGLSPGEIIGIVVGIFGFILIVCIIDKCRRKYRK